MAARPAGLRAGPRWCRQAGERQGVGRLGGKEPPPRPPTRAGAAGGARGGPGVQGVGREGGTALWDPAQALEENQPCVEPPLKNVS